MPTNCPIPRLSVLILTAVLLVLVSCSKHKDAADTWINCISRITPLATQTLLRNTQIDSINTLFAKNSLSTAGLQFFFFTPSVFTDSSVVQAQITADPFLNGLPIFGANNLYIFNNGIFVQDFLDTALPVNNDTTTKQSLSYLGTAFFQHVSESVIYGGLISNGGGSQPPSPDKFKDSCLKATLGYLDARDVPGSTGSYGTTLVKVWEITTLHTGFPAVYVKDDNGTAWGLSIVVP